MAGLGLLGAATLALGALCLGSGCSTLGYYAHSVGGHLALMNQARPVPEWLADPATPAPLRQRLELAQQLRRFAVDELALPDNASYRRYADLKRPAVVWNVVAAPELSLTLKTWCFPVAGCVGYRGYFNKAEADALAAQLQAEGLEVYVYGVPAYSTLGYLNWAGGDPLLNTFIQYPEGELAKMIFHELAHQVFYLEGDTAFNESFATAVERLGVQRWLAQPGRDAARQELQQLEQRRREFRALTARARAALAAAYQQPGGEQARRAAKQAALAAFRDEYATLKRDAWAGYAGYDAWVARANNAALSMQGAYNDQVAGFERLFQQSGENFPRFYEAVRALAARPVAERQAFLKTPH